MRKSRKAQQPRKHIRPMNLGWRRIFVLGLIGLLLPGCTFNLTQILIPLAYASIGTCIALLVSPSASAAVIGFALGGVIGAAVYNNSLKADLWERQGWDSGFQRGK